MVEEVSRSDILERKLKETEISLTRVFSTLGIKDREIEELRSTSLGELGLGVGVWVRVTYLLG